MSELPKGWVESTIGEACLIENGLRKPISLKERANCQGDFPYYGATGVIDHLNSYTHKGEYVLIGEDGANLLSKSKPLAFIANGKYWVNNHAHTLRCLADSPNLYLEKYFNSLSLESWVTGSAQPKLTKKNLESIPYPLAPLAEQKRIVEKLDEVLAQVDTIKARLDGIPELLKRFRQSVLASAVSGKLTESSSSTWLEGELSDVATFQNGYAFKSGWFSDEGDFQVIKLGNVKDDYLKLDTAPAYLNSKQAQEYLKFKPSVGDILLSMTGTKFKRDYGFACLVERDLPVLINQRVGRILPERKKVIPEFLHLHLRSELFRNQFFAGETGGVNQGNVGSKHIMSCKLSIPSLENQHLIASKARNLFVFADTIEAQVKKAQVRVDNLTQSILAKAFRGELVAQDPNDEPADKLLEHIAEARKEAEALAKVAKKAESARKKAAKSA